MAADVSVICDFDGTITTRDIGQALFEKFAPGVLDRVDERWHAGELNLREAFELACRELRTTEALLVSHALESAELRPGFEKLVELCAERGVSLIVASGGLDLYIEPILRRHFELDGRHSFLERRTNVGSIRDGTLHVTFVQPNPNCIDCLTCKGRIARRQRSLGHRVIGVGDSVTDRCLSEEVDHLFARDWLAEYCRARDRPHEPFEDFTQVSRLVRELTS